MTRRYELFVLYDEALPEHTEWAIRYPFGEGRYINEEAVDLAFNGTLYFHDNAGMTFKITKGFIKTGKPKEDCVTLTSLLRDMVREANEKIIDRHNLAKALSSRTWSKIEL